MPDAGLIHLIYYSTATHEMGEAELLELLQASRQRNAELGITGMLLYGGGVFLQVIEGAAEPVDRLFARIEADPRHHSLIIMEREEIGTRAFAEWSMGFHYLAGDAGERFAGAFSLGQAGHGLEARNIRPGPALELLLQFARTQR